MPGRLVARWRKASGVDTLFTVSGEHLFSIYDGCRYEGIRLIDTRHKETAAFAAEGWSKMTRSPGVAALAAGVTDGMSAMTAAQQDQSPQVVLGGCGRRGRFAGHRLAAVDVLAVGAGQFLIGALFLAVAVALADGSPVCGWSVTSVVTVVTPAVVGTALPYVLWFTELRRASITAVTSWTLLVRVVGLR